MRVAALVVLAACAHPSPKAADPDIELIEPEVAIDHTDYASVRASFRTHLTHEAPAPQPFDPLVVPPGVESVTYAPGLVGWLAKPAQTPSAAVLFLHGGWAFGADDWTETKPYRDAGFVVFAPILRGENGQPGAFSFFYNELDDVLAAAAYLRAQPFVDPQRIYVAGVSAGGTLALLAAEAVPGFRAAASISASPDQVLVAHHTKNAAHDIPVDVTDLHELGVRSPLAYAESFKCPVQIYYGLYDHFVVASRRMAEVARAKGLDVTAIAIKGDHDSSVPESIAKSVAFFRSR
jgi:dipeptidyl aminopeptidase/acylaminoacyl peptidase